MQISFSICKTKKTQMERFILIAILVISPCLANTNLLIGEYAQDNNECKRLFQKKEEIYCSQTDNSPVCAVLFKEFVFEDNHCTFCTIYGNSPALVVELDSPQSRCKSFKVGDPAKSDPHCWYFYNKTGPKYCTREGNPICAVLDKTVLTGGNKCDFCTKYGNTMAIIKSIGQPCFKSYDQY